MADFYQTGVVATFHRLGKINLEKIEAELSWYSQARPIALVLPSLYAELEGDALKGIVHELKDVKYVKEIVVTLGPAKKEEFERWSQACAEKEKQRQEKDRVLQEEAKKAMDKRMRMNRIKNIKELQALQREIDQIRQNNGLLEEELIRLQYHHRKSPNLSGMVVN